jgi:hypothetical protein
MADIILSIHSTAGFLRPTPSSVLLSVTEKPIHR